MVMVGVMVVFVVLGMAVIVVLVIILSVVLSNEVPVEFIGRIGINFVCSLFHELRRSSSWYVLYFNTYA